MGRVRASAMRAAVAPPAPSGDSAIAAERRYRRSIERERRREVNAAYELGPQEGWLAALRQSQEDGLERVVEREAFPPPPIERLCDGLGGWAVQERDGARL